MTAYGRLAVPSLRAKMGDNVYYIGFLSLKEVANRVSIAQDIHKNTRLRELIQRQVTSSVRTSEIATYLHLQSQRFFSALIIGVYDGAPDFYEISIEGNEYLDVGDLPSTMEGAMGILVFTGAEKLFAIDGQHRVAGIKRLLQSDDVSADLAEEEVCTIFVAAKVNEPEGLERTRRLFTTLNRYAKPVSMMDIITKDEDDVVAIVTRDLLEQHPLLQEYRIAKSKGKAISATDDESFTTIVTVYEVLDIILTDRPDKRWKATLVEGVQEVQTCGTEKCLYL